MLRSESTQHLQTQRGLFSLVDRSKKRIYLPRLPGYTAFVAGGVRTGLRGPQADPSHLTQLVLPQGSIECGAHPGWMGFFVEHAMELSINGETVKASPGLTVLELLEQRNLKIREVVVERNFLLVPKDAFASTLLEPGDSVEILHFVGGG
jgi:thiamine biosynthesis protein ThiS